MEPKVLLLQETLSLYSCPVYKIIAQHVDLTVAYTIKNESKDELPFKVIKLDYTEIGGIYFIKKGFYKMVSQYDVVIFSPDPHSFSYCSLPFIRRKYKVIPWTIGIRASYKRRYDLNRKKDIVDRFYGYVLKKSDAIIFYMKAPLKFWGNYLDKNKVFIAHNTVEVLDREMDADQQKSSILFVGTLYKEKMIYELIDAYMQAKTKTNAAAFLHLDIIGKGEEYDNIKALIKERQLIDAITLHGPVYDEMELSNYFSKALLCVSPDQAGLSVLKSMGYGVPYVTRANAITGGERLNIIDKENGLLYNTPAELVSIIEDAYKNPDKYITMGINAQQYYMANATTKHMAHGAIDAINYVLK